MNDLNHDNKKKQQAWNPNTIKRLKKEGSNLRLSHSIENVFYAEEKKSLVELGNILESRGYQILNMSYNTYENNKYLWCMIIKINLIPEIDKINEMTDLCVESAYKFNCDYDGWYTTVVI